MSVPGNINTAPPPSSFDDDPNFYEESRWAKLRRKITEEPLIPLGCALTCWALYEATKSMRAGDKHRTNRMFRRRIYAQGFTILAMVAGSTYWEGDRAKRKQFDELTEEKRKKEKRENWLRELEIRDQEEQELRRLRNNMLRGRASEQVGLAEESARAEEAKVKEEAGQNKGGFGSIKSVLEPAEGKSDGLILAAARQLWDTRR